MLKKVSRDVKAKVGAAAAAGSPGGLAGPGGVNGPIGSTRYSIKQAKFWWVKAWGYEASAYFFDYLDPVLRKDVVKEFNAIMKDLKAFPVTDPKVPDPFDFKKLLAAGTGNLSKEQVKMLKDFTSNYDAKVYDASGNVPQIAAAMTKWKWRVEADDPTFYLRMVQKYDMNFDGRLSSREFLLLSIYHNKQTVGTSLCTHCYEEIGKTLEAIFLYLDCDNNGLLTAEEIWNNISSIKRPNNKWNMFAFGNSQSIRTASINDFILKHSKTVDGAITKAEWTVGVLLGFWDRQTDKTQVYEKEERNLKKLRWKDDDMTDIALYNYYKKSAAALADKK